MVRHCIHPTPLKFQSLSSEWSISLMSAYYPVVLTGASLIVCFWAEVFHLREVRWDRPRFLSKVSPLEYRYRVAMGPCKKLLLSLIWEFHLFRTLLGQFGLVSTCPSQIGQAAEQ